MPLAGLGEGDFRLRFDVTAGDTPLAEGECDFSLIKDLRARVAALAKATEGFEQDKQSLDKQTARALSTLISSLAAGEIQETDFPAARLLAEAEAAAFRSSLLTLTCEMASFYFNARALDSQISILESLIKTHQNFSFFKSPQKRVSMH